MHHDKIKLTHLNKWKLELLLLWKHLHSGATERMMYALTLFKIEDYVNFVQDVSWDNNMATHMWEDISQKLVWTFKFMWDTKFNGIQFSDNMETYHRISSCGCYVCGCQGRTSTVWYVVLEVLLTFVFCGHAHAGDLHF